MQSEAVLARGGGGHGGGHSGGSVHVRGYTRKDGTYVAPYTRSAPGTRSLDDGDYTPSTVDPQPLVDPQTPIESQGTNERDGGIPNPGDLSFSFPMPTCGDKPTGDDTWYPVFIDGGNIDAIRQQFCADAISTVRQDTGVNTIQVASFNSRDRAVKFAQLVRGEVGKPTLPDNQNEKTNPSAASGRSNLPTINPQGLKTVTVPTPSATSNPTPTPEASISAVSTPKSTQLAESDAERLMFIPPLFVGISAFLFHRHKFRKVQK